MTTEREIKLRKSKEEELHKRQYLLSLSDEEALKLSPSDWYTRHRYLSEIAACEYIRNIRHKREYNLTTAQSTKCYKSSYYERDDSF